MNLLNQVRGTFVYPLLEKSSGRKVSAKLKVAETFQKLSAEQKKIFVENQLFRVLEAAYLHTPYYRELFKKIGFHPEEIRGNIQVLNQLPYLTKEILSEQSHRLLNEQCPKKQLVPMRTGGSTGSTTTIYYNSEAFDWAAAANRFALKMAGRDLTRSEAHLMSQFPGTHSFSAKVRDWLKCQAMNRTNLKTGLLTNSELSRLWQEIKIARPYLIQGHPSTMSALALYLEANNLVDKPVFAAFESTGETLDKKRCQSIEKNLGCKIFNRYGSAEFGVIAHSSSDPFELELFEFMVMPEALQLGNGLTELVFTGLQNQAMPLIRYRSGDVGELDRSSGRPMLRNLRGRIHDFVELDRAALPSHYIMDILNRRGDVDDFQFVLHNERKPELRIVKKMYADKISIQAELSRILSEKVDVHFVNPDQLMLSGWRDKYRFVVRAES